MSYPQKQFSKAAVNTPAFRAMREATGPVKFMKAKLSDGWEEPEAELRICAKPCISAR